MERNKGMSKFKEEVIRTQSASESISQKIQKLLDEESYKDFLEVLQDKSITAPVIVSSLKTFGIEVNESTIRRWRKK